MQPSNDNGVCAVEQAAPGAPQEAKGILVRPERFELPTLWFEAKCSIQLSYGRGKKELLLPKIAKNLAVGN
jgi:hypothetical protein